MANPVAAAARAIPAERLQRWAKVEGSIRPDLDLGAVEKLVNTSATDGAHGVES